MSSPATVEVLRSPVDRAVVARCSSNPDRHVHCDIKVCSWLNCCRIQLLTYTLYRKILSILLLPLLIDEQNTIILALATATTTMFDDMPDYETFGTRFWAMAVLFAVSLLGAFHWQLHF